VPALLNWQPQLRLARQACSVLQCEAQTEVARIWACLAHDSWLDPRQVPQLRLGTLALERRNCQKMITFDFKKATNSPLRLIQLEISTILSNNCCDCTNLESIATANRREALE
jgi:hypothetical protein